MKITQEIKPKKSQHSVGIVSRDELLDERAKFKKGHPKLGGKQKGYKSFKAIWDESIVEIATLNNITPEEAEKVLVKKAWSEAKNGSFAHYKDIQDRLYGQATAKSETINKQQILNINFFANPKIMSLTKELDQAIIKEIRNENQKPTQTLPNQ